MNTRWTMLVVTAMVLALSRSAPVAAAGGEAHADGRLFRFTPLESEPTEGRQRPTVAELAALAEAVAAEPRDRARRFELVRARMAAGDLEGALGAAREWRAVDAYNLVVVRLIGDILSELGRPAEARRAYSAVVELLPEDPGAQRALATVLKQGGDIEGAHARLLVATRLRENDTRLAFELADVTQRLGRDEEARERFEGIVASPEAPEAVRYPAKQRLAQLLGARRQAALASGRADEGAQFAAAIAGLAVKGGADNDLKVYLSWDTDGSDVDLWVTNPRGEKVYYDHKRDRFGAELFHDVTTGYGPESYTATRTVPGAYLIQVHYYGTDRSAFPEARGEVVVVVAEGRPGERRFVVPYRLFEPKQTVTVGRVDVEEVAP